MQAAGLFEDALVARQQIGKSPENRRGDRRTVADPGAAHFYLVERGLAADAARRARQVPAVAQIGGNGITQAHRDDVEDLLQLRTDAVRDRVDVVRTGDQTFGETQAGRELEVVPRRPHRDREWRR